MSNLDTHPTEFTCAGHGGDGTARGSVLSAREVPLGGPRAMTVRRTLPQRARSLIGAWCFVDHFGPDIVADTGGMRVDGHPHTGLQTVSWLFSGEIEHRDTTGAHATVRPGELNLMTAGSGIAHSEHSTPGAETLHGVQLWIALPDRDRFTEGRFEHHAPEPVEHRGARIRVLLGDLAGQRSPISTHTPLLGAEVTLPAGSELDLEIDPSFEHGVLVDTGSVTAAGCRAGAGSLVHQETGTHRLHLSADPGADARLMLLGGEPLGERIVMWWNFVGRSHDEIAEFREQWQRQRTGPAGRFGTFPSSWQRTLPAPALPNARLRPRG